MKVGNLGSDKGGRALGTPTSTVSDIALATKQEGELRKRGSESLELRGELQQGENVLRKSVNHEIRKGGCDNLKWRGNEVLRQSKTQPGTL